MVDSTKATIQSYVRMSDIVKEPQRMLMPIHGYERMSVLSLEEAVLPLVFILPRIQNYAFVAKQRCEEEPADGLTQDESASIMLYSMEWKPVNECLYFALNAALRGEDRRKLKPWFSYLNLILKALSRLPSTQRFVYRGVNMNLSPEYTREKTFIWWGFSSCASSIGVLENDGFLGKTGTRTLFTIDCHSGKDISRHSYYKSEDEILLLPARRFQVMSCLEPAVGLHIIQLKEIESSFPLLEPVTANSDAHSLTFGHKIEQSTDVDQNIHASNLSKINFSATEKLDNVINSEDVLTTIPNEIAEILALDDDENKDKIINDLLENGRQSLTNYQEDIPPRIYNEQMNGNESELMRLLKTYFQLKWKTQYGFSNEWFISFLEQYKNGENCDHYEHVLTRTAQYGNKYTKNCPVLSIVLQLLFEDIDDQCLQNTNVFNELWVAITNDGLESIINYSEYIIPEIMNEQINKKQPVLFRALREFYREELFQLLIKSNITVKENLFDSVLDNVAEHGWTTGVQAIQKDITPRRFKILLENLNSFRQQNVASQIKDNTELIETTTQSSDTIVKQASTRHIDIPTNARWSQNGITVAGGHGVGYGLNQLSLPHGLYIDEDQTVYIADYWNSRIVKWKRGATSGQLVAGGNEKGNRADQLNQPSDVIIDKETDSFIISDWSNRRVVRWPRGDQTNGQTIISDIECRGLTIDDDGFLYVSDREKNEVRRCRVGDTCETVVAGGSGKGDRLDQLNFPIYVFVDRDNSVFVSERDNNRVTKWMNGANEGIIVAGGQGRGNALTQLSYPQGVVVDQLGTVYVADEHNHRIMRWPKGATQGNIVVGGNGQGGRANQFNGPIGLSFDRHGNLYVADLSNTRVQRFDIEVSPS